MKISVTVKTDTSELEAYLRKKAARMRTEVITELAEIAKTAYTDDVMGTWKTDYPVVVNADTAKGTAEVSVIGRIPFFLNGGTSVRYATMTPDFVPKTSPNVLRSGPGAGGLAFVSKNVPNPGIEAREFDQSVADEVAEQAAEVIIRAWNRS